MITINDIKKKSERKYSEVLRSILNDQSCFPLEIRSNKTLSKDFVKMRKEIADVLSGSKDRKGYGYSVISSHRKTRQHGSQDIPTEIVFDSLSDFLKFIGKEQEFHMMMEDYHYIKSHLPQLDIWLKA